MTEKQNEVAIDLPWWSIALIVISIMILLFVLSDAFFDRYDIKFHTPVWIESRK